MAWRVCERIKGDLHGDEEKSFQKIPGLLLVMQLGQVPQRRGETYRFCEYDLDIYAGVFVRCWVLPQAIKEAFRYCRKFVTMDGIWTKSRYRLNLLVIFTADGNGNALPLAWALVNRENIENWRWFLSEVAPHLSGLAEYGVIIISNRQKGLIVIVLECLPGIIHGYCCQHISDNIVETFGRSNDYIKLFWRAVRAKIKASFNAIMMQLVEEKEDCAIYLKDIDAKAWAYYAFPVRRWMYDTSNISESVNSSWMEGRDLPAFNLLLWVWNWTMNMMYERRRKR